MAGQATEIPAKNAILRSSCFCFFIQWLQTHVLSEKYHCTDIRIKKEEKANKDGLTPWSPQEKAKQSHKFLFFTKKTKQKNVAELVSDQLL